jgi:hypothetical protein
MQRQTKARAATMVAMANAQAVGVNVIAEAHSRLGLHSRFESIYRQKEKPRPLSSEEPGHWKAVLEEIGYHSVAEFVAEGYLPAEFAKANDIPLIHFFDWWNNCPKDLVRVSSQAHAQTSALKAELILSIQPPDKESAEVMKESAKFFMRRAEVYDPALWQQGKVDQQSIMPIVFNFGGNIQGISSMKVVSGIDKPIPMSEKAQSVIPTFSHVTLDDLSDEPYYEGEEE